MRKMLKGSKWPLFYWAKVPVLGKQTDTVEEVDCPFLLPHEAIAAMNDSLDMQLYFGSRTSSPMIWAQLTAAAQLLGCTPEAVLSMGLHGDGVPFNVGGSLEQFSFNFPLWTGEGLSPRLLFTAAPQTVCCEKADHCKFAEYCSWVFQNDRHGHLPCYQA